LKEMSGEIRCWLSVRVISNWLRHLEKEEEVRMNTVS